MKRLRPTLLLATLGLVALAPSLTPAATARPATDDVMLTITLGRAGGTPLPGTTTEANFGLLFLVETQVGVVQAVKLTVGLPDGLRWGRDAPDPGEGCQGAAPAICTQTLAANPGGTVGGGYYWDVVADHLGSYEVTATVEPTEPDPNLSNNTSTFRFEVVQPASSPGAAAAVASAAKLTPAKPRAGSLVTATVRVVAGGAPVTPARVTSTGQVGGATVKGTPGAASGSATCRYRTPRTAHVKALRGTISFTARSTMFTKRFSTRLR
jgi:hypothetical protein